MTAAVVQMALRKSWEHRACRGDACGMGVLRLHGDRGGGARRDPAAARASRNRALSAEVSRGQSKRLFEAGFVIRVLFLVNRTAQRIKLRTHYSYNLADHDRRIPQALALDSALGIC